MTRALLPALWLLTMILGLPYLSDTFTSSLPDVAEDMNVPVKLTEYAFTIYLSGFAVGVLFWGELADKFHHKMCVLIGLCMFIVGCLGCYFTNNIWVLMVSRFGQAFGSSSCYVLGHAVCRSTFHGRDLGRAYASIETALAVVPTLGSFISSMVEYFSWRALFLVLSAFAFALSLAIALFMPKTHSSVLSRERMAILVVAARMFKDKKVIGYGIIIAGCWGIYYSYYIEGVTYLVNLLGLSPNKFDFSFIAISAAYMVGGITSRLLHSRQASDVIMKRGVIIIAVSGFAFSCFTLLHIAFLLFPDWVLVLIAIISQSCIMFGSGMTISNALTLALADYHWCTGAASSIFGFFYYTFVALITLGMGILHNGTLLPMPLYFFGVGVLMLVMQKTVQSSTTFPR